MKTRGSVVSLTFIFPHPPENEKNEEKKVHIYRKMRPLKPHNYGGGEVRGCLSIIHNLAYR